MSFSNTMKANLCRMLPKRRCCMISELSAMIKVDGKIIMGLNQKTTLRLITENVNVAKRIYSLMKELTNLQPYIVIRKSRKLKEHNKFILSIDKNFFEEKISDALIKFYPSESKNKTLKQNKASIKKKCCIKAYLRGIFLSAGSITNPNNCYHVEIVSKDSDFAEMIKTLMEKVNINAKIAKRKNNYIVYIKEAEKISLFLNIIGAHSALLDLENIRILKEMRNNVNRIVNCETSNLVKTVDASVRQINCIKYLKEIGQLDKLPKHLSEIAYLRLQYPDSSLKELGMKLNPSIGKSGVNHRLKSIEQIAEEFREGKE